MAFLFTDTTYDLHLGLLSQEHGWLSLSSHSGQKVSAILQAEIHSMCKTHSIKPHALEGIITVAGPGFYTGLRLSEGFADIFKIFGVPQYAFYSYEIPKWCGQESGVWVTKAYRGEYFFHEWNGAEGKNTLVPANNLDVYLNQFDHVYIHSPSSMDRSLTNFTSTLDLLKEKPDTILNQVIQSKPQRESFYFRAPEDEFRVSK